MSELKKKLDGARSLCLPRALVLINPGNPTGALNVYLLVITCNNINEDDDDDDDDDDDIVLAHSQVSAFELSFHRVSLTKGRSLYQGVSFIGVLFAGVFLLIPGCPLSRQSLNYVGCPLYRDSTLN